MTPLTKPVPHQTIVSVAVDGAVVDAKGRLQVTWRGFDLRGIAVVRHTGVVPEDLAKPLMEGSAGSLTSAAETALAALFVAQGEATLPAAVTAMPLPKTASPTPMASLRQRMAAEAQKMRTAKT